MAFSTMRGSGWLYSTQCMLMLIVLGALSGGHPLPRMVLNRTRYREVVLTVLHKDFWDLCIIVATL